MRELVFHRLLVPAVERKPAATAYVDTGTGWSVTFEGHLERVARLTSGLPVELGVNAGDRVAVLSLNSLPYVELWHAALLGGAVINPLNLRFSDEELAFVLADSGSRVCFVDATFADTVDRVRKQAGIETVVLCGGGDDVPHDVTIDDVVRGGVAELPPEPEEDDPVVLMYTGGTTGLPKGVLLEQRAEVLNE